VTARIQTGLLEPAMARPAVTARLIMTSGLITQILRPRRTAAAGTAAMPGLDSSRPKLARTHRASALTRPAALGVV
jgi:hypothetical protein